MNALASHDSHWTTQAGLDDLGASVPSSSLHFPPFLSVKSGRQVRLQDEANVAVQAS